VISLNVYLFIDSGQTETVRETIDGRYKLVNTVVQNTRAAPEWALRSNL